MQSAVIIKQPLTTKWAVTAPNRSVSKHAKANVALVNRVDVEIVTLVDTQRYAQNPYARDYFDDPSFTITTERTFGFKVFNGAQYRIVSSNDFIAEVSELTQGWAEQEARQKAEDDIRQQRRLAIEVSNAEQNKRIGLLQGNISQVLNSVDPGLAGRTQLNVRADYDQEFDTATSKYNIKGKVTGALEIKIEDVMILMSALIEAKEVLGDRLV